MTIEDEVPRLETGISGFDVIAHGGLPKRRSTLVTGGPGTGKTLFAMEWLARGAQRGEPGVLVTIEERSADILQNVRSLGWGLDGFVDDGTLVVIDATAGDASLEIGEFDLGGLMARIAHAVQRTGATRLAIDSLGALVARSDGSGGGHRRRLFDLLTDIRSLGVTTVITAERGGDAEVGTGSAVEEFVADAVVLLRNKLQGHTRVRTVELLKVRGGTHERGTYPFALRTGTGMEVIPLAARRLTRPASSKRSSLGHPRLDELTGGGVFHGSITLVSGGSGAGKTTLVSHFIAAAIQAGERAVFFSFEESADQILRNAASIGLDLRPAVESGDLRIIARYPERLPPEDLLAQVKIDMEAFGPSRIAFDSLSALGRTTSIQTLRDFVIGFTTYLKETDTAGMLTELAHANAGTSYMESPAASLCDCVIALRMIETDKRLERTITVIKVRGSAHDHSVVPFTLHGDGLRFAGSP